MSAVALCCDPIRHEIQTSWTANDGRVIQATFLAVVRFKPGDPDSDVLVLRKGEKTYSVALRHLDPQGAYRARRLEKNSASLLKKAKEYAELEKEDVGKLKAKMDRIKFARLHFVAASLDEVVEFLRVKSRDLDPEETDADKKGVNITLSVKNDIPIHLGEVTDVSLSDALIYVTELTGTAFKLDSNTVRVGEIERNQRGKIFHFRVNPDFFGFDSNAGKGDEHLYPDPFASVTEDSWGASTGQTPVMEFLIRAGITFERGTFAVYDKNTASLYMLNTAAMQHELQRLVDHYRRQKEE